MMCHRRIRDVHDRSDQKWMKRLDDEALEEVDQMLRLTTLDA